MNRDYRYSSLFLILRYINLELTIYVIVVFIAVGKVTKKRIFNWVSLLTNIKIS